MSLRKFAIFSNISQFPNVFASFEDLCDNKFIYTCAATKHRNRFKTLSPGFYEMIFFCSLHFQLEVPEKKVAWLPKCRSLKKLLISKI